MWLNEGFDVFLEWKVSNVLYGTAVTKMMTKTGNSSIYEDMLILGPTNPYTSLRSWTGTKSPEDAYSNIPYEKGY